jgi:hypothetical protein
MTNKKLFAALATLSLALTACSLEAKKAPSLLLRFDPTDERESVAPMNWFRSDAEVRVAPTMSQFACIGVNVTGPGINDSSISNPDTPAQTQATYQAMLAGSSCSYRGVVGGLTFPAAGATYSPIDVSLNVPAGSGRMIQVFGVGDVQSTGGSSTQLCSTVLQDDGANTSSQKMIYELARAQVPSLFSSQSITLNSNLGDTAGWSSPTNKLMDCETNQNTGCTTVNSSAATTTYFLDFGSTGDKMIAIPFVAPNPLIGTTLGFTVELSAISSTSNVDFQIYTDSSPSPNVVIGTAVQIALPAAANSLPMVGSFTGISWTAGAKYWLVIKPNLSAGARLPMSTGGASLQSTAITNPTNGDWGDLSGTPKFNIRFCQ